MSKSRCRHVLIAFGALTLAGWPALQAQPPRDSSSTYDSTARPQRRHPTPGRASPWLPRLRLDNDAYNFWIHPGHRSDEEYTNGVVASLETLRGLAWGRRLGGGAPGCGAGHAQGGRCLSTTVSLGQDIYTPNLGRAPFLTPDWEGERPYAAWLYVGATGRSAAARSLREVDIQLGVTGRPALGSLSQSIAHWVNRRYTTPATGWETQVGFQPGLQLGYRHAILAMRGHAGSKAVIDLVPSAAAVVGTVRTQAHVAAKLRLGYNLSHPFDPRRWRTRTPLEYFVSAAGKAELVARDFSLDGSLLGQGRRVERLAGVREYAFGAGLRMQRLFLQWEATTRSKAYTTGPALHAYSAMSAGWEFYR